MTQVDPEAELRAQRARKQGPGSGSAAPIAYDELEAEPVTCGSPRVWTDFSAGSGAELLVYPEIIDQHP